MHTGMLEILQACSCWGLAGDRREMLECSAECGRFGSYDANVIMADMEAVQNCISPLLASCQLSSLLERKIKNMDRCILSKTEVQVKLQMLYLFCVIEEATNASYLTLMIVGFVPNCKGIVNV